MPAIGFEDIIPKKKILPSVGIFLIFAALFSAGPYYLLLNQGLMQYYMIALMWSPGLAALLTCRLMGIRLSMIGWKWGFARWQILAFAIPVTYGLIAYFFIWGMGLGKVVDPRFLDKAGHYLGLVGWSSEATLALAVLAFGGVAMVGRIANALGEEIAWRGFLVPLFMQRFSLPITSLVTGLIWAAWHAPLIFYTQYNAGPYDLGWQFLNFTVLLVSLSFILTYLRLKSGSVWTAAILHAAHNAYVLSVLDPMTVKYEHSWRFTGEFGLVLPLVAAAFAAYFWYRARRENLIGPFNQE